MKWIKVSQQRVPRKRHVLAYIASTKEVLEVRYYYEDKFFNDSYSIKEDEITHWMELPEGPDEVD